MLDCRTPDMREVIWQEVFAFLSFYIGQTWEQEYGISAAHIATVLLHIYSERENKWQAVIKTKNAKSIATLEKEKVLALITNPHEYGAFILSKANVIEPAKRIFYVTFPGYDVAEVPGIRDKGIKLAKENKRVYMDQNLNVV